MLTIGAPAKITMHAGHWVLVLLQRSWCMQGVDAWCSFKNHDACRVLIVGAPAKITMHAGCWPLVHLQRSQCHLAKSQLWHCKKIMMLQKYLVPGTPEEIAILFKAVPGWNHDFLTCTPLIHALRQCSTWWARFWCANAARFCDVA